MKKWIVVIVMLMCSVCFAEKRISIWGGGIQGLEGKTEDVLFGRIGYMVDPNIELGGLCIGNPPLERTSGGFYGFYHFPTLLNVDNPIPLDFLPDKLTGTPYGGVQVDFEFTNRKLRITPVGGLLINKFIFVEYWPDLPAEFRVSNEDLIMLGLNYRF